jgi:hypothetical protein
MLKRRANLPDGDRTGCHHTVNSMAKSFGSLVFTPVIKALQER